MLNQEFINNGFCFITSDCYLNNENSASIHDLKKLFELELEEDGSHFRKRAYLKVNWNRDVDRGTEEVNVSQNQHYFQTAASNKVDGGKIRQFKMMTPNVLKIA